jgi:KDO2-lipid IV(A) lauroyltransferase
MGRTADEGEVRRRARHVFLNFGRSVYYFLRFPRRPLHELLEICDYEGIDVVVERLRSTGGFIVAGPHVGPWEIGGACLSALGIEIHTVALDHPSARVTDFFDRQRKLAGIVCHPIGGSFLALSKVLSKGRAVALLIDRSYEKNRRTFSMFGRHAELPVGHAALAVRCRAPVLTAVCVFARGERLKFDFNGPHYPDFSRGEDAAVEELHDRCRQDMERFIRDYPDQWFHFQPFAGDAA